MTSNHPRKMLRCDDVIAGCSAIITGDHLAEMMVKFAHHVKQAHGMASISARLAVKVKIAIRDEPPPSERSP